MDDIGTGSVCWFSFSFLLAGNGTSMTDRVLTPNEFRLLMAKVAKVRKQHGWHWDATFWKNTYGSECTVCLRFKEYDLGDNAKRTLEETFPLDVRTSVVYRRDKYHRAVPGQWVSGRAYVHVRVNWKEKVQGM